MALLMAFIGFGLPVQIGVFLVVSVALLILTRPVAVKFFNTERQKTNAESLIGRLAVVTAEINNLAQIGEVIISDVSWTARSRMDSNVIPVGSKVKICAIEGVKLIVEKAEEEQ